MSARKGPASCRLHRRLRNLAPLCAARAHAGQKYSQRTATSGSPIERPPAATRALLCRQRKAAHHTSLEEQAEGGGALGAAVETLPAAILAERAVLRRHRLELDIVRVNIGRIARLDRHEGGHAFVAGD